LNGTYVRLVLEFNEELNLAELNKEKGHIISTLFPHETKLSVMHFKIQRHFENTEPIPSEKEVMLHCGFRVFVVRPMFS
jgi:pre-rRNA-processing protein TSR1